MVALEWLRSPRQPAQLAYFSLCKLSATPRLGRLPLLESTKGRA